MAFRVFCLNCKKELRMTMAQADALQKTKDGELVVFCGAKCQKAYIVGHGEKEKKEAMARHAKNLGINVEDLPR